MREACAALCLALAACGGSDGQQPPEICSAIACINGLGVIIASPPQGAFRVEIIAPGETTPHAINCSSTDCGPSSIVVLSPGGRSAFFENYFPGNFVISIVDAIGSRTTYNKSATYTLSFPNGPQCNIGGCRSAVVTVP